MCVESNGCAAVHQEVLWQHSGSTNRNMLQVVAGLKQHVEREVLLGSLVVAILNLKPAKLAGEASEAMLLAADAPLEAGGELVKVLIPPGEVSSQCDNVTATSSDDHFVSVMHADRTRRFWKILIGQFICETHHTKFAVRPMLASSV